MKPSLKRAIRAEAEALLVDARRAYEAEREVLARQLRAKAAGLLESISRVAQTGAIMMKRKSRAPRRSRRAGSYVSSRPWIVYRRVMGVPALVSRFGSEGRARELAREEGGVAVHLDNLGGSMRRALGLRG